jgi:tetratricopeptide (TPR) repeat protein
MLILSKNSLTFYLYYYTIKHISVIRGDEHMTIDMQKRMAVLTGLLILLAVFTGSLLAQSKVDEARKLYQEASTILRNASGAATDPKVYAQAVFKLRRAQKLVEEAAKSDPKGVESLQVEINAALFWAMKFTTLPMVREIEKGDPGRKEGGSEAPVIKQPPKQEPKKLSQEDAEKLFHKAEAYEKSHQGDDYAIALRWFQVADETTGTDWSLRAMSRARDAQERHKAKQEKEKAAGKPQTKDGKLIYEGDVLFRQKQYEQALVKYKAALIIKDSTLLQRRIGHSYMEMGYEARDKYAKQYLPLVKQWNDAVRRRDKRRMDWIRRQTAALVVRLKPLENKAKHNYTLAEAAFMRGLNIAKGKDLDCEAQLAIIKFQRKERTTAHQDLTRVLRKYKPQNDEERTVYEYCRSLLQYINKSKK